MDFVGDRPFISAVGLTRLGVGVTTVLQNKRNVLMKINIRWFASNKEYSRQFSSWRASLISRSRAVIKRWGPGISPGY